MYRTGIGFDTHKLVRNRKLILGGVEIHYKKGLLGYSDADVLIHAMMDSILGAVGLRDIGVLFPNDNFKFKNISSLVLLKEVYKKIEKEYKILNLDSIIICQAPKLSIYIDEMKENVSGVLKTKNINIKATTTEKMNAEGKGKCISAQAVVMLEKIV